MTIEEMRKRKEEQKLTYKEISRRSGIPLPTVQKILGGSTQSPRYKTIQALEAVLGDSSVYDPLDNKSSSGILRESQAVYGKTSFRSYPLLPDKLQGEYTAADLARIPEDIRVELIDGVIYDLASPANQHQMILGELYEQIRSCIKESNKDCLTFFAPSDVWLFKDEKTVVQPDLYIICDYSMLSKNGHTKGAPPFVAEILSPSSRSRDLLLKNYIYGNAGVREYWCIDPGRRQVLVYDYSQDPDGISPSQYTFHEKVPIRISDGKCSIDFSVIDQLLNRVFG